MEALIIAGCCLLGAILAGLAGWLKSGEPFVARDFLVSILSGVGAAIVFALAYNYTSEGITVFDVLAAIAAGMGIDVAVNRVAGAVRTSTIKKINGK
jgi:hypothetical protein